MKGYLPSATGVPPTILGSKSPRVAAPLSSCWKAGASLRSSVIRCPRPTCSSAGAALSHCANANSKTSAAPTSTANRMSHTRPPPPPLRLCIVILASSFISPDFVGPGSCRGFRRSIHQRPLLRRDYLVPNHLLLQAVTSVPLALLLPLCSGERFHNSRLASLRDTRRCAHRSKHGGQAYRPNE